MSATQPPAKRLTEGRGERVAIALSVLVLLILIVGPFARTALVRAGPDPDEDGLLTERERTLGTDPWDADTDGDAIPDGIEVDMRRYDLNYGDPPAIDLDLDDDGLSDADPFVRDIFVEVDHMEDYRLNSLTVGLVEKAFRESPVGRIAVHVDQDAGSALPSMPCFGLAAETRATFVRLKGENFDASRESVFHYAVLANRVPLIDSCKDDVLGQALGLDTDFVIAFARLRHDGDSRIAAVFMHELGHNLGLTHEVYKGIDSSCTHPGYACYDPDLYANYESVMNYHFQRAFGSSSHWRLGYSDGAHGTDRYGNPDFDDWGNLVFASIVMRF